MWIVLSVVLIWIGVLLMSLLSPDLVFGTTPERISISAIANWFWGLLATVFVLRSTVFLRPHEVGWGQHASWPWIALGVAAIWTAGTLVSLAAPTVTFASDIDVPIAAVITHVVAATLTWFVCQFLVEGFAARNAGTASG